MIQLLIKIFANALNRLNVFGMKLGKNVRLHGFVRIENPSNVSIGSGTWINGLTVVGPGKVMISENCIIRELFIETNNVDSLVVISEKVFIGRHSHFICAKKIEIGQNTLIAPRVTIIDNDHKITVGELYKDSALQSESIYIGQNVWLGTNVTVLKGVSIHDNSVIGASSLVLRNVPSNKICVGNPLTTLRDIY